MISYTAYKLVHFLGLFLTFVGLAALLARPVGLDDPTRRRLMLYHGLGLFLVILGGFGMMSRLGIAHTALFPGWIWLKLSIWICLAALVVVPKRRPEWARPTLLLLPFLGLLGAFVALVKPL